MSLFIACFCLAGAMFGLRANVWHLVVGTVVLSLAAAVTALWSGSTVLGSIGTLIVGATLLQFGYFLGLLARAMAPVHEPLPVTEVQGTDRAAPPRSAGQIGIV
jgi:hypothetical protein